MPGPWLKFYPSDWQADPLLGTCSLAARGLWIEALCVMHAADPPGSLVRRGAPLTVAQIAVLARTTPKEASRLLTELEDAGVFSRDENGMIFSRRMQRDLAKAERDRSNGRTGGNPTLRGKSDGRTNPGVNPPDKPKDKGEDKAQIPEARYQKDPSRGGEVSRAETPPVTVEAPLKGPNGSGHSAAASPDPAAWTDDAPLGRHAGFGGAR